MNSIDGVQNMLLELKVVVPENNSLGDNTQRFVHVLQERFQGFSIK